MNKTVIDQMGREVSFAFPPRSIVSLVPSMTELLHFLGLEEEVIGITKFCIKPDSWFRNKERIGGTKNLKLDRIREIDADLLIGNKEENNKADIDSLSDLPVWMSDIETVQEGLDMIRMVGELVGKENETDQLILDIESSINSLVSIQNCRVAYLIWREPYMAVGSDTFINDMLTNSGFDNVYSDPRYFNVELKELAQQNPDFVFLSSEPYPFSKEHFEPFLEYFDESQLVLVDGEMFSWPGVRMKYAFDYIQGLIKELKS